MSGFPQALSSNVKRIRLAWAVLAWLSQVYTNTYSTFKLLEFHAVKMQIYEAETWPCMPTSLSTVLVWFVILCSRLVATSVYNWAHDYSLLYMYNVICPYFRLLRITLLPRKQNLVLIKKLSLKIRKSLWIFHVEALLSRMDGTFIHWHTQEWDICLYFSNQYTLYR